MPRTQPTVVATFYDLLKYIETTDAPFARSVWPKAVLSITSLASMWMYVIPSMKAGEREDGEAGKWLQLFGNTSCAALVVFNIGGHYIGLLETLRDILCFLKEQGENIGKDFATDPIGCCKKFLCELKKIKPRILLLSGVTAMPLAAAALFYRDWDTEPEALLIVKMLITLGVYTLIHTLPISLILNVDWLNFLLVKVPKFVLTWPLIVGKSAYQHLCTQHHQRLADETTREQQQNIALRAHVAHTLGALIELRLFVWKSSSAP